MRSDDFEEKYRGVRIALVGELVIEFVYGVGVDDYAVNICRINTDECTKLNRDEWETLCVYARQMRAQASNGDRFHWIPERPV